MLHAGILFPAIADEILFLLRILPCAAFQTNCRFFQNNKHITLTASSNLITMNIMNTNTCILAKLKGKPVLFQRSYHCFSLKTTVSRLQKYSSDQSISSTIFISSPIDGAFFTTANLLIGLNAVLAHIL